MHNKFAVGDKVETISELATEDGGEVIEKGVVVHHWYNYEMQCFDYYIAFFGHCFPLDEPDGTPYVLRYAESSLKKSDC